MKPTLLVIEGLDGAGKSTQTHRLADALLAEGRAARVISFPDYADESSALVRMYLRGEFGGSPYDTNAYAASLLYAADRFASYRRHWQSDYEAGVVMIADRYTEANIIHQMNKLPRAEWSGFIDWLYDLEYGKLGIPRPDRVVLFDVHPDVGVKLTLRRYDGDAARQDIHERDKRYLEHCREAALFAAERLGWSIVRCDDGNMPLPVETITEMLRKAVADCL